MSSYYTFMPVNEKSLDPKYHTAELDYDSFYSLIFSYAKIYDIESCPVILSYPLIKIVSWTGSKHLGKFVVL